MVNLETGVPKAVREKQAPVMNMKSTLLQAFTCTYCEQYFSTFGARKRHVMRHKSKYRRWIKAKKRSSLIRSVLAPYQCAVCNAAFLKISSLENHVKVDHILVTAYGCNLCPFASFQDRDSYVDHVVDHVKNTLQLKAAYQCVYCKQCFVNNTVLGKHLKAEHEDLELLFAMQYNLKIYQCGYCKQCFADNKLRQHILNIHKIDKPFCCKFCRQCFTDFPSLSGHAQSMHIANPYHCEDCNMKFPDFSASAHHVNLVHRRDMYFCHVCKHGFAEYSNLARHAEQTHKQSQTETPKLPLAPYRCQICRKTHYNTTDLLIHARVTHGHTWADLAIDLAACVKKPVRYQDERERENIAGRRRISESGQMIRLARSTGVTTNDRIAEPETYSLGMVSNANSVMDPAKTEEESLSDLSYGASSQDIRPRQCQPHPGKVRTSALTKNTGMSESQGNISSPNRYIPSLHKGKLVRPLSPYVRFMHNVLLKKGADYVNLKPWQVDKLIRDLWNKLPESDAEKARLKSEYKVNQTVYVCAVKKRIERGKANDHTYTRPPSSHQITVLQVEQQEEKEIFDAVTVTEETQPQIQVLSKLISPQQRHLKMLVGLQNGTVVSTQIALSSNIMQPVVSLVNMKSLLLGAFCKPKIKLLLLDAEGKPRRHQPYLEEYSKQCRLGKHNVNERKRRSQERLSYFNLGEHVPAITSKERVSRIDILKHSTEYIHTQRNEEEKLVRVKDMERQRHEQLQEQLRNLQNGNVVVFMSVPL